MNVLFLCKSNVGRSQMAEALFNSLSKKNKAMSAGTLVQEKEGQHLHEYVISSMKEIGLDVSKNVRRQLTSEMADQADRIIVVDDENTIPPYLSDLPKVSFWDVPDAKGQSYEFHCKIRDQIKTLVQKLVAEVG